MYRNLLEGKAEGKSEVDAHRCQAGRQAVQQLDSTANHSNPQQTTSCTAWESRAQQAAAQASHELYESLGLALPIAFTSF